MKKLPIILLAVFFIGIANVNAQTDATTETVVKTEEVKETKICAKTGKVCDETCKNKAKGTCCKGKKKTSCSKSKKSSCSKSKGGSFNFTKSNNYGGEKSSCSKKAKKGCCKKKAKKCGEDCTKPCCVAPPTEEATPADE
jgi:hypothetical protein